MIIDIIIIAITSTQHLNTNKAYNGMFRKPKGEGVDLANEAPAMAQTRVKFSLLYMSSKALPLWQYYQQLEIGGHFLI